MEDMKEALGNARKPDITHVRKAIMYYIARACEYGNAKGYERANFARSVGGPKEDFERLREYLRATIGHFGDTLEAMELHLANDPNLEDVEGMKAAAYAADTDAKGGCETGPSLLPHMAHGCASAMMALTQATVNGLLPLDPGQPWAKPKAVHETLERESNQPQGDFFRRWTEAPDMPGGIVPESVREEPGNCPHDVPPGMTCNGCEGGWARREVSEK